MKAILFAAGLGTRLRPLTNEIPKCLINVGCDPIIYLWIEKLENIGVSEILINTHHLADKVHEHIRKGTYKAKITLSFEETLLGTAGTIAKNIDFCNSDEILLIHADNYLQESLNGFLAAHRKRTSIALMTMMVFRCEIPDSVGMVELGPDGIVKHFFEKDPNALGNLANGAIYLVSRDFFRYFNDMPEKSDFSVDVIPKLMGRIFTYETKGFLIDIGTLAALSAARDIAGKYITESKL